MGFKVKEIRLAKNISQEELSKASGVSRQTISDLESGEVVNTTTSTLAKLADALECKVGDIFCPQRLVQQTTTARGGEEMEDNDTLSIIAFIASLLAFIAAFSRQ